LLLYKIGRSIYIHTKIYNVGKTNKITWVVFILSGSGYLFHFNKVIRLKSKDKIKRRFKSYKLKDKYYLKYHLNKSFKFIRKAFYRTYFILSNKAYMLI
jgi:hypothetical protein